jgi:hypothetical protein
MGFIDLFIIQNSQDKLFQTLDTHKEKNDIVFNGNLLSIWPTYVG